LIVKACCGLLIALSLYGCVDFLTPKPSVPANLTRQERLKMAADFTNKPCEKLWDLLWPLARKGDGEALSHLVMAVVSPDGLQLPGSYPDSDLGAEEDAVALAMAIYAAAAPTYPDKRLLGLFIAATDIDVEVVSLSSGMLGYRRIKAFPRSSLKRLESCLVQAKSTEASDRCINLAMQLELVPSFSEFRNAMDNTLSSTRSRSCNRPRVW
jgi:hypothetical protein